MIKRFVLGFLDLRAQARLLIAMARHDDAVKVLQESRVDVERAGALVVATGADLDEAKNDADLAAAMVRRHRQRMAVGLR